MNLPLNIDFQQVLLHLFNFTVLFGVLYFLLYKPVKDFMDQRTAMYKKMDDDAKDALQDAENAKSRYLEKLAAAEEEIEEKKDAAYKEQEKERAVRLKQAEEEAAKIVADAHQKMEKEHAQL